MRGACRWLTQLLFTSEGDGLAYSVPTDPLPPRPPVHTTRDTIEAIVSVFETGTPQANYGTVALLQDGAGISYGKHQATDRSGTLDAILLRYIDLGGTSADALTPYVRRLSGDETARVDPQQPPQWVKDLMMLLRNLGEFDPVMRQAQDEVFSELYWEPAQGLANAMKLELPLSHLVVYDTAIHSGPLGVSRIRKLFPEVPPSSGGDEKKWTRAYLFARQGWLRSHPNPVVQNTMYRVDEMLQLAHAENWHLQRPIQLSRPPATIK